MCQRSIVSLVSMSRTADLETQPINPTKSERFYCKSCQTPLKKNNELSYYGSIKPKPLAAPILGTQLSSFRPKWALQDLCQKILRHTVQIPQPQVEGKALHSNMQGKNFLKSHLIQSLYFQISSKLLYTFDGINSCGLTNMV